ncbi:unnamed protein product [Parnassius apollo]|uniref:(apollo) hypothetical protein n=1 Tax=Parnassius apollo TaxID=110799 RepID=A0A8S3XX55_PARAO|nr:unnamed protein product [Parnassius apollo]
MGLVKVKMCRLQFLIAICLLFFILDCNALNCRIKTSPAKESELKRIYSSCLRKQGQRNNTYGKRNNEEHSTWSPSREYNPKSTYDRERTTNQNDRTTNSNDRTTNNYKHKDRIGVTDAMAVRRDVDYTREVEVEESTDRELGRSDINTGLFNNDRTNGEEYKLGDDYNEDSSQYGNDRSLSKLSERQKREKRNEMNSGQRSQYNPNIKKRSDENESRRDGDQNSQNNVSEKDFNNIPCALHCFMESLQMTDDSGMPNKYLVTQAITKDIQNDELKDFLQESADECFEMLSANREDKCEFSKNLLMCLSDKGKSNCDDWKDDVQF